MRIGEWFKHTSAKRKKQKQREKQLEKLNEKHLKLQIDETEITIKLCQDDQQLNDMIRERNHYKEYTR